MQPHRSFYPFTYGVTQIYAAMKFYTTALITNKEYAKYNNAVLLQETGLATHHLTLETATQSSPVASEKAAFVQVLAEATETFDNIKVVTTDGHTSIASYMRNEMSSITHNQVRIICYCPQWHNPHRGGLPA